MYKKKQGNKAKKKSTITVIGVAVILCVILAIVLVLPKLFINDGNTSLTDTFIDRDIVISIADITETATFYKAEVDNTKLEVIAVKASDGTIRTAFNTCQVCYSSGKGYYKQSGDVLVCQNCGNRFKMTQVEIHSGGCNPVPIFSENKIVTDETITIPLSYLVQQKKIFSNWKIEY